ncbi:hypothetical protein [Streptomyces sp. NPDC047079]|uniref:hypothetical protein n=1 Tax=Streptomyces sp. NPDC047079 TaxID=3154607 RepID=UPI0033CAE8FD
MLYFTQALTAQQAYEHVQRGGYVQRSLGLLLAVWVTAASVSDNTGGIHLLSGSRPQTLVRSRPML